MGHTSSPRDQVLGTESWTRTRTPVAASGDAKAGWIARKRTAGIDQLRSHRSWSSAELVQLVPGRLDLRLFHFTALGLDVEGGSSSLPLRFAGTTPADRASVTFLLTGHGRHLVDACTLGAGTALAWAPGTTAHGIASSGSGWVTMSVPLDTAEDLLPAQSAGDSGPAPLRHARMPARVRHAMSALLRDLEAWGPPGCGRLDSWTAERIVANGTQLLTWALRACTPVAEPGVHALHAAEVVRVAEGWLARHLRADVYVRDLRAELGVPERTLEDSFHAILGISPMRYLELLRAHAVFRALRSTGPDAPATVREAEAQAGVRHPARFAARYRALFGENPAATLRTTRRGTACASPGVSITG